VTISELELLNNFRLMLPALMFLSIKKDIKTIQPSLPSRLYFKLKVRNMMLYWLILLGVCKEMRHLWKLWQNLSMLISLIQYFSLEKLLLEMTQLTNWSSSINHWSISRFMRTIQEWLMVSLWPSLIQLMIRLVQLSTWSTLQESQLCLLVLGKSTHISKSWTFRQL